MKTNLSDNDIVDLGVFFQDYKTNVPLIFAKAEKNGNLSLSDQIILTQNQIKPTSKLKLKKPPVSNHLKKTRAQQEQEIRQQLNKEFSFLEDDNLPISIASPDSSDEELILDDNAYVPLNKLDQAKDLDYQPDLDLSYNKNINNNVVQPKTKQKMSKSAIIGLVLGSIATSAIVAAAITLIIRKG